MYLLIKRDNNDVKLTYHPLWTHKLSNLCKKSIQEQFFLTKILLSKLTMRLNRGVIKINQEITKLIVVFVKNIMWDRLAKIWKKDYMRTSHILETLS